jgi:hypothetical protein
MRSPLPWVMEDAVVEIDGDVVTVHAHSCCLKTHVAAEKAIAMQGRAAEARVELELHGMRVHVAGVQFYRAIRRKSWERLKKSEELAREKSERVVDHGELHVHGR